MATRQKLKDYKKLSPRNKAIMIMLQQATEIIQMDCMGEDFKFHFSSAIHNRIDKEIKITYVTHVKEVEHGSSG